MVHKPPAVAVLGGGMFGCVVALALADAGLRATIFERKSEIMEGASKNNQNRLHLGFHYPRDLATARQCAAGFDRFMKTFPTSISGDFPNAYFVALSGSLTSPAEYLEFCDAAGLSYTPFDVAHYPTEVRGCAIGLLCQEVVYDCGVLKSLLASAIERNPKIELRCKAEVSSLARESGAYRLSVSGSTEPVWFDAVINCCYADINRLTAACGHPIQNYQFEYTAISIVESDLPRQGITVMDGPFMTLLPYGKSDLSLLYHSAHSVVATSIAPMLDPQWRDPETAPFSSLNREGFFETMKHACGELVPVLARARLAGFLEGPRMVLPYREKDDARPSFVQDYGNGYLTVFSGKIDHCIEVAEDVRRRLQSYFGEQES